MYNTIIRHRGYDAAPKPLMANAARPLIAHNYPPVLPALAAGLAIAKQEESLAGNQLRPSEPGNYTHVVDDTVSITHPSAEVRR